MLNKIFFFLLLSTFSFESFSQNLDLLLKKAELDKIHLGIQVKNLTKNQLVFQKQEDFFFMPASTQKMITYYVSNKYLKDTLASFKWMELEDTLMIAGTGDPSFLHTKFQNNYLESFIQKKNKKVLALQNPLVKNKYPMGWAWEDFPYYYMTEISTFPIYGNVVNFNSNRKTYQLIPDYFKGNVSWKDSLKEPLRDFWTNQFFVPSNKITRDEDVPFIVKPEIIQALMEYRLRKSVKIISKQNKSDWQKEYYQPTDTLYRKMLHDSDNMIAEQLLLCIAAEKDWEMETESIIEKLQEENPFLNEINWVDGSGLSRYDLVRPIDMTQVLEKIYTEIPEKKWKNEMAKMGEEYKRWTNLSLPGKLWAKTGSYSNTFNLVGFYQKPDGEIYSFVIFTNLSRIKSPEMRRRIAVLLNEMF